MSRQGRGQHGQDNRGNRVNRGNRGNGPITTLTESISKRALHRRRPRATIQEWPELVHINRSLNAANLGESKMENFGVEFIMDVTMADMHVIITKTVDDGWLLFVKSTAPECKKQKQIKITEAEASAIAALMVGENIFDEDSTLMLYEIAEPVMLRLGDPDLRCIP